MHTYNSELTDITAQTYKTSTKNKTHAHTTPCTCTHHTMHMHTHHHAHAHTPPCTCSTQLKKLRFAKPNFVTRHTLVQSKNFIKN